MVHYPDSFPTESISFLVPLVRNGQLLVRRAEAAEHAWNVLGYAMGQTIGHEHVVGVGTVPPEGGINPGDQVDVADEQLLFALEQAASQSSGPHVVGAGFPGLTTAAILKWALTLFLKLITG